MPKKSPGKAIARGVGTGIGWLSKGINFVGNIPSYIGQGFSTVGDKLRESNSAVLIFAGAAIKGVGMLLKGAGSIVGGLIGLFIAKPIGAVGNGLKSLGKEDAQPKRPAGVEMTTQKGRIGEKGCQQTPDLQGAYAAFMKSKMGDSPECRDRINKSKPSATSPGIMNFDSANDAKTFFGQQALKSGKAITSIEVGPNKQPNGNFIFADKNGKAVECQCPGRPDIGQMLQGRAQQISSNPAMQANIIKAIEKYNSNPKAPQALNNLQASLNAAINSTPAASATRAASVTPNPAARPTPPPSAARPTPPPSAARTTPPPTAARPTPPPTAARTTPPPTAARTTPPPTAARTTPPPTAARTTPPPTAARTTPPPTAARTTPPPTTARPTPPPTAARPTPPPTAARPNPIPAGAQPATPSRRGVGGKVGEVDQDIGPLLGRPLPSDSLATSAKDQAGKGEAKMDKPPDTADIDIYGEETMESFLASINSEEDKKLDEDNQLDEENAQTPEHR